MKVSPTYFEFKDYEFKPEKKEITFHYESGFENKEPLKFTETLALPDLPVNEHIPAVVLENILQGLHLILGVSYYKLYCPPRIKLNSSLSRGQADFWNTVYRKGLGEFCYRNKIDPDILARFPSDSNIPDPRSLTFKKDKAERVLLGLGGGKDSIVALELLKEQETDMTAFVVETQRESGIVNDVIREAGLPALKITRYLDEQIFAKHEGSYNGHVPISAVFAWTGLLAAALYDYAYVAVANEYSSNFGNIAYKGEIINHQWSKSGEFELLFQEYTRRFITPDITYFSPLRPFYEIRIVEMFGRYKKYRPYFTSCNNAFKVHRERSKTRWCGECPKCVFMFALLAAYLEKEEVIKLFGRNLLAEENLLDMYRDLLGYGDLKPFDCVGTFDETRAAIYLARNKFKDDVVIKTFVPKIKDGEKLAREVKQTQVASTVPVRFKFTGMKKALILGYGREGKITERYLKKYYPDLEIGIADAALDKNYLDKQKDYDIAVKTPGISKDKVKIQYTTATNLFFDKVIKTNKIIGVTGTKGKSTTASLIYACLKEAGYEGRLLGNIGKPMLEALMEPYGPEEIFVLELSSYQLEDIQFSPQIAVILNLGQDHMDYHGGLQPYYEAKRNILKYQRPEDYFVYNKDDKKVASWASEAVTRTIPFVEDISLDNDEISLLGEHNIGNIKAAAAVARLFDISDDDIKKAVKGFKALPHRLELVGEFNGIKFYDDAISTTPESTIAAIKSISNIGTIMLGGQDRGYDFSGLSKIIRQYGIKNIVLFPDSGARVFKDKEGLNILETSDMEAAVRFAYEHTPPGQACLLSTASPSYSVWKDFEEKGNAFQEMVKKWG